MEHKVIAEHTPTDAQIQELIWTLATASPDFKAYAEQHAGLTELQLSADEQVTLGRELLKVLRESPQQAAQIEALVGATGPERYEGGLVSVPMPVAVTFLLRTHVRFKRRADGKWELQIEHKPADSALLTQLLKKLGNLLPGGEDAARMP